MLGHLQKNHSTPGTNCPVFFALGDELLGSVSARLIGTTLEDGNVLCEAFSLNGRFSLQWAQVAR
jgi:hypothetical protein